MIPVSRGAAEVILQLATTARPNNHDAASQLFERMLAIWESLDAELAHPPSIETPCHAAD